MTDLLKGWFCDRATGQGKPVYTSGTLIVPTNGIVGGGLSSPGAGGGFSSNPPALVRKTNLLDGWFCDRATGQGKVILGDDGPVPVNGPKGWPSNGSGVFPGGKFYFEFKVGSVSTGSFMGGGNAAQIGFINPHQRDTINSTVICLQGFVHHGAQISGPPAGGRTIPMGQSVDSAIVGYVDNFAQICGNSTISIAGYGWHTDDYIGVAVDTINNLFWTRNWTQTVGGAMNTGWNTGGGSEDPETGAHGFDISSLTGDLFIWFGAPGILSDSVVLNAGAGPNPTGGVWSQFHGIDGTGVIPAGFTAWDQSGATAWDASAAVTTTITGFTQPFGSGARLQALLSNGSLTATITTKDAYFFGSANPYASTWEDPDTSGYTYPIGSIVMGGTASAVLSSLYWSRTNITSGSGYGAPSTVGGQIQGWAAAMIGVVSNTGKART